MSGALAIVDGTTLRFYDDYCFTVGKKGNQHTEYDDVRMREILFLEQPDITYLEIQHAMPKQGVTSTFKTGMGYGLWRGLLAGLNLKNERIRAQDWQQVFFKGLGGGDTKNLSYQVLSGLYPDAAPLLRGPRGGLFDGRCDAGLIAVFGTRRQRIA